jgi:uncharacterized protein YeeX (DUF496 family)
MEFLESFVSKPVRETAGSRSSNRFDYQKNWSLCELLVLQSNCSDYLMVFEYHDDIVVFDSQDNPSNAIFYQVKSKKSGNWTIGALTKGKDDKPSILKKLYENYQTFPENVKRLVFTSNQPLTANLKNGDKAVNLNQVKFLQLSDKDKEKIQSSVEPNEQCYCNFHGLYKIETEKNELRPEDHTVTTKGKLVEFFENHYPDSEINISLVYKTFFDEIRRKSNHEDPINRISDLLNYKSIRKSDFERMIGAVTARTSDADLWQEACNIMNTEGYSFQEIRGIKAEWQQYIVNKMNVTDDHHLQFITNLQVSLKYNTQHETLKILIEGMLPSLKEKYSDSYDDGYIKAAIIYEVLRNDPISETNKKLTEETK